MVGARRAEPGQAGEFLAGAEIEHRVGIGEVTNLRVVGRRQAADDRSQGGRPRSPLLVGQRFVPGDDGSEGLGGAPSGEEGLGGADDVERVRLARVARVSPSGDAVAAEDDADRLRVRLLHGRDLEAELESRASPRHPHDAIAEALLGQRLAVRRRRQRDARVRMEMIDMRGIDETVHRGVDRGCRAAAPVQAVVEGGDHLVFSIDSRVDVDERAERDRAGAPRALPSSTCRGHRRNP